jgi:hypothetical protein
VLVLNRVVLAGKACEVILGPGVDFTLMNRLHKQLVKIPPTVYARSASAEAACPADVKRVLGR